MEGDVEEESFGAWKDFIGFRFNILFSTSNRIILHKCSRPLKDLMGRLDHSCSIFSGHSILMLRLYQL